MNPKHTWLWVLVAAGLFTGIFLHHRFAPKPPTGPAALLPGLEIAEIASVEIIPANQHAILVERTNHLWQLTEPVRFPAHHEALESLLTALAQTIPGTRISAQEFGNLRDANDKFGFNPPTFTVILQPGDQHIQFGNKNGPGDQVFVKVVGADGVAVVDAGLLKLLPRTADDWRETALVDFAQLDFDSLTITNGAKILELHGNPTNGLWRMTLPMEARADALKITESLGKLQSLRALQFLDRPASDLETMGLQPPDLSLAFKRGTNTVLRLAFGKALGNSTNQLYARRNEEKTVMAVAKEPLDIWHAQHETFRDRHLISPTGPLAAIEFHAQETFTLRRTNTAWIVTPQNYPADAALVTTLLTNLGGLQVAQFYKDAVVAPDLPALGLATPVYQINFQVTTNTGAGSTNVIIAGVDFGTNQDGLIFARRLDEPLSVYSIRLADVQGLPINALQLRDRTIWKFTTNDVARVTIRQNGKVRQLLRKGAGDWSLAPGSQGILDEVQIAAIEETVFRLGELAAEWWVEPNPTSRERYGFKSDGLQLTVELLSGKKLELEFGGPASLGSAFALVTQQEPWVFTFPPVLHQLVQLFLTIPDNAP